VTFKRIVTGAEVELSVPGEQLLSWNTLNTIKGWFAEDPESTRIVVLFYEPFLFDPREVTTGAELIDSWLAKQSSHKGPKLVASMFFHLAYGGGVEVQRDSTLTLLTGFVRVNGLNVGKSTEDIIPPVPMPRITIASNGHITFE
jgi:hypothetical protein